MQYISSQSLCTLNWFSSSHLTSPTKTMLSVWRMNSEASLFTTSSSPAYSVLPQKSKIIICSISLPKLSAALSSSSGNGPFKPISLPQPSHLFKRDPKTQASPQHHQWVQLTLMTMYKSQKTVRPLTLQLCQSKSWKPCRNSFSRMTIPNPQPNH